MQKCIFLAVLIEALLLSFCANAGFDEIKLYPQNVWDFELTSRYLSTNSNYSSAGGAYSNLPTGCSYTLEDFNFATRTSVPGSNWSLWGDSQVSSSQSKNTSQSLSATGLTHVRLGTDFILFQDAFNIIPEFSFLYPITTNNFSNTSLPAISEGVMTLSGKVYLQFRFSRFWLEGFTGYVWRDQSRSALVPYGLIAETRFKTWSLGANVQGYSSASSDGNTNNSGQQLAWMYAVNGNSQIFDALNPQLLETNFWVKFNLSKSFATYIGGGATINGTNAANYWDVQVGIAYRLPSNDSHRIRPKTDIEKFNEETSDGVDQTLFDTTPGNDAVSKPKPKINRNGNSQNIQKELDKTEVQIEMKSFNKNHKPSPGQESNPTEDQ